MLIIRCIDDINILDAIITDPRDELYALQAKYNVKISRSNKSSAVYIFRHRRKYLLRVGHYIDSNSEHLWNFSDNVVISGKVEPRHVEKAIRTHLSEF